MGKHGRKAGMDKAVRLVAGALCGVFLAMPAHAETPVPYETLPALMDNILGSVEAKPLKPAELATPEGQETMIRRRSFLARHAALQSVPALMTSWKAPGSAAQAEWVKELRREAGVPESELSDTPSYKEVLHALAVDRTNTGKFAHGTADPMEANREVLIMNSLYLMQLRDYYELLERTALTLSVQLAMLLDGYQVDTAEDERPR